MFLEKEGKLIYSYDGETVCIEAWGKDALRVRATKNRSFTGRDWALEAKDAHAGEVEIFEDPSAKGGAFANMYEGTDTSYGKITNGKLHAVIDSGSVITFYHEDGRVLLKEHFRRLRDEESMPLNIMGREYSNGVGDNFRIVTRFVARKGEKIFGMGQYQQHELDLKGCMLELAQRNSQVSVPFYLSSIGYGFLWNNPGVGQVMFANNGTEWVTESGKEIDYLVIAGDTPAEIEENYMTLTGKPPMMPEYGMGFWQCKLRYWNQEQLLSVARKYKELGVPLDVIVVDFFHWTKQGEFKFDPKYWPDVPGMCRELKEMGIQVVVSVWPTVDIYSENFEEMKEKGYLVRTEHGVPLTMLCGGNEVFFDATNPDARTYVWEKIKKNYYDQGAKLFWLDVAEPEYSVYDFKNYRYQLGSVQEVGNIYPKYYLKAFYDGMTAEGDAMPISLIRSAWAGSAKYGALVWSGDIVSSFECFQRQVQAGLNMAIAGIPWWTTDIGGFYGPAPEAELFVRWVQNGIFQPRFSIHSTNTDNTVTEPWMFSDKKQYIRDAINFRYKLSPLLYSLMVRAHESGLPIWQPTFAVFQNDPATYDEGVDFMFGDSLLVANVVEKGQTVRPVYLPKTENENERFYNFYTREEYAPGQTIEVPVDISSIPLFVRSGAILPMSGNRLHNLMTEKTTELEILMAPDVDSEFVLYEDDGCTNEYLKGAYLKTRIAVTAGVKTYVHFTNEGNYDTAVESMYLDMIHREKSPFYVQLDGKELPHFLHRRKFEEAESGWYYSQRLKSVQVKYPNPKKDHEIMVSFEQFDLIGM